MHRSLLAAALGASIGIDFGRRGDRTGICVLSKDGEIIDMKTMDSTLQDQKPDLVIIDEIPPMVSDDLMDKIIDLYGDSNHGIEPHQGRYAIRGQEYEDSLFLESFERAMRPELPRNRFFRPIESRPAFTSPKPMTKRQKRRTKGKKQC